MNPGSHVAVRACPALSDWSRLLIAALLLSTIPPGFAEIPLDIDATLISGGTGTALDSASLAASTSWSARTCRWCPNSEVCIRSPTSAERGHTFRSDRQLGAPTSRRTAGCCWRSIDSRPPTATRRRWLSPTFTPAAPVRRAGPQLTNRRRRPLRHVGLYQFPFERRRTYFGPIAQKAFDATTSEEDVNGLTTPLRRDIGYTPEKLVAPLKYPSLCAGDEDG